MAYGVIEYRHGLPVCEICDKTYKRLMCHVRQAHDMSAKEYKECYGLNNKRGICSAESSALARERVLENAELCIKGNLTSSGAKTRFTKGDKGRTKDQVREQERRRLAKRAVTDPAMVNGRFKKGENSTVLKRRLKP